MWGTQSESGLKPGSASDAACTQAPTQSVTSFSDVPPTTPPSCGVSRPRLKSCYAGTCLASFRLFPFASNTASRVPVVSAPAAASTDVAAPSNALLSASFSSSGGVLDVLPLRVDVIVLGSRIEAACTFFDHATNNEIRPFCMDSAMR